MIKLPENFNYAEAYLTFRCNLGCSYCINRQSGLEGRTEILANEWIKGINNIDFGDVPLTLGGGEPTLHPGFYKIIEGINPNIKLDLLTNLSFDINEFIQKIKPERFSRKNNPAYKSIRASYHAEKMGDGRELVGKVMILQSNGFDVGIFGLNHPFNTQDNVKMAELCRQNKIYFFIKDFLGWHDKQLFGYYKYPEGLDGKRKNATCRTRELLIAPDGNTFRCHRDLYHNQNPITNILHKRFAIDDRFRLCGNYGNCNPCDVKMKTNRFLQMGNCSVEIK